MIKSLLRLWLAAFLILAASAVLLLTDRERSRARSGLSGIGSGSTRKLRPVALFQHVSQPSLEEGVRGVMTGLAESGYEQGRTIQVRRYNAEGDAATSNTIAREIVGDDNELVITLSTPEPPGSGRCEPRRQAPARLRDGERPGRRGRRDLAG